MASGKNIVIVGESPLVEEYGSLCAGKGFHVGVRLNEKQKRTGLPRGLKVLTKPPKSTDIALELTNISLEKKRNNLAEFDRVLSPKTLILSSSVTVSVSEQTSWLSRPRRFAGIGALPSLLQNGLIELAVEQSADPTVLPAARDFVKTMGKESAVVRDTVGLVLPRILCMLANEAYFAMIEGVASGQAIDTAMKLGTNYPFGPVEWAGRIGVRQVCAVVAALHRYFGEDRYRIAPLLRQAAHQNAPHLL